MRSAIQPPHSNHPVRGNDHVAFHRHCSAFISYLYCCILAYESSSRVAQLGLSGISVLDIFNIICYSCLPISRQCRLSANFSVAREITKRLNIGNKYSAALICVRVKNIPVFSKPLHGCPRPRIGWTQASSLDKTFQVRSTLRAGVLRTLARQAMTYVSTDAAFEGETAQTSRWMASSSN